MPFYAGQQGKMFIDSMDRPAAKVVNWSFSSSQAVLDTTTLSDTDRTLIYGIRSLSGSCRLFYYHYTVGGKRNNDCALLMAKIMKTADANNFPDGPTNELESGDGENAHSDSVILDLRISDLQGDRSIKIPALITGVSMTMAVGEVLAADITFESNGAPSFTSTNITTASEQVRTVLG